MVDVTLALGLANSPQRDLSVRVLNRLRQARVDERDPFFVDDLYIAYQTVHYAFRGSRMPHLEACYAILATHPDQGR